MKKLISYVMPVVFFTAGTGPVHAEERILEEVLVVAQKREQRLQDVPVAVSAISGNVIEQLGMDRMEDLEQLSPSLSVGSGSKNTNGGMSIRGIGNNGVFSIQAEPAVLVIFDEVSQAQGGQAFTNIIDVERIEVLRGPQNTLFGEKRLGGCGEHHDPGTGRVFRGPGGTHGNR